MAPKRTTRARPAPETTTTTTSVTNAQLQAMIDQGVTAALAARDATRNGDDSHTSGTGVRRTERVARECTYQDFMKCQPLYFKGTEGVVELTQWFERMETVSYALSWKPCQGDSLNLPDHRYSIYTIKRETRGLDDGVAASFQRSRIHKPHAHTQAFKVNHSAGITVYKGYNVIGALLNVTIFVGTNYVVTDFAVLEDMDAYRDKSMGDVIVGEPFLRKVGIKARRFDGMITIYNGDDEITYQMVSEEDKTNGISHSYQKLKGFYKGVLNLGPDYILDAKMEEWLTRGHVSVHEMELRSEAEDKSN
ncbi:hypothetical protein Tco_0363512 [Tanacetum coccineum]